MTTGEDAADGLLVRSQRLARRVGEFQSERDMVTEASRYHTRADELERPAATLSSWLPIWRAFQQHGISVTFDSQALTGLRKLATTVVENFEQNTKSLIEPNPVLRRSFWEPLGTLERDVESALSHAWSAYVESLMPPRQDELLDVLTALPDFRPQVANIRGLYREEDALKQNLRPDADVVDLLGRPEKLAGRITAAIGGLRGAGIPTDVLEFIKQASTPEGATYNSFSGSVRDWFLERGLLGSLRVRLGGGN
jgi:hypothetical protein